MRQTAFTFIIMVSSCVGAWAQDESSPVQEPAAEELKAIRDAKREERKAWNKENTIYSPILGVGAGFLNYFGEVTNNDRSNVMLHNLGVQFMAIKNFTPSFGMRFDVTYGRLSAHQRSSEFNHNFSTDIIAFNIHGTYSFAGILAPNRRFNPFVSVGIGAFNFTAKSDLRDANGRLYHHWADGTVRSLAEGSEGAANAEILTRDYVYETDLRKANLDSLGNYPEFSMSIPFTLGFNLRVSPRSNVRLQSTFHYTLTDLIDGYTRDGRPGRVGDAANDMFMFTSISYQYDFFSAKKDKGRDTRFDNFTFESLEGDSDGDGVIDAKDRCPDTPKGAKVDEFGCPVDNDNDGVYDHNDEEPATDPALNVNRSGVGLTDDMIQPRDTVATKRSQMYGLFPDMAAIYRPKQAEVKSAPSPSANPILRTFDSDSNGRITVDEVYQAIDKFFDGELDVTAAQLTELVDYFFEQ